MREIEKGGQVKEKKDKRPISLTSLNPTCNEVRTKMK